MQIPTNEPSDFLAKTNEQHNVKIPHLVLLRTRGLLDMDYALPELAAELGMPASTLRDWARVGMPHYRDTRGHIWINGGEFTDWVAEWRTAKPTLRLKAHEAYCLHCRGAVDIVDPQKARAGSQPILVGRCRVCHSAVSKGVRGGLPSQLLDP